MKSYRSFLSGVLFLLACSHEMPIQPGNDLREPQWAMYGGNVRQTGNVNTPAYDGIVGPTDSNTVSVKWAVNLENVIGGMGGGNVQSQLVSDKQGNVYVTTIGGLVVLDPNGNLKWHFDELGRASVTTGDDGTVYYHGNSGNLYGLDSGGTVKWKTLTFKSGDPYVFFQTTWMNLVVLKNNIVAVTGLDSLQPTLIALNGHDGSIVWKKKFEENSGLMSIDGVADDGTMYVYQEPPNPRYLAIESDGTIKWSLPRPGGGGAANFHVVIDADGILYKPSNIISPMGQIISTSIFPGYGAMWYQRYYATYGRHDTLGCYSISERRVLWRTRPDNVESLSYPTVDAEGNMFVLGTGLQSPRVIPGFLFVYNRDGRLLIRMEIHAPEIDNYTWWNERFAPLLVSDGSVVMASEESPIVAAIR